MPTCHGYIRVSTQDQADSGHGLDACRDQVRQAFGKFTQEGYVAGEVFEDPAVSAKVPLRQRPGGGRLDLALGKGDLVVVPNLTRAFRSVFDMILTTQAWQKRGVRVVYLELGGIDSATPAGEFIITVWTAFAQLERRMVGERTAAALAAAYRKGKHKGVPPPGCTLMGKRSLHWWYEVDPNYHTTGLLVIEWREKGHSWEAIHAHLMANKMYRERRPGWYKSREWTIDALKNCVRFTRQVQALFPVGRAGFPYRYFADRGELDKWEEQQQLIARCRKERERAIKAAERKERG